MYRLERKEADKFIHTKGNEKLFPTKQSLQRVTSVTAIFLFSLEFGAQMDQK